MGTLLGLADYDLDNFPILPKVLITTQCLQKFILTASLTEANDID